VANAKEIEALKRKLKREAEEDDVERTRQAIYRGTPRNQTPERVREIVARQVAVTSSRKVGASQDPASADAVKIRPYGIGQFSRLKLNRICAGVFA